MLSTMSELSHLFKSVRLPAMPEIALALIKTLNEEDVSAVRVRGLIAKDPALAATVLRMANSAMFGLSQKVSSLDKAISLVGMAQIRSRALSVCLRTAFPVVSGMDRGEFWRSSMAAGTYAQWLAAGLSMDTQQAWLTGMMLRLGELILAQKSPDLLVQIEKLPCLPGERWSREHDLTGFSEGQITAELARRWDFPSEMVQALNAATQPMSAQPYSRLAAVVHLAGLLADMPEVGAGAIDELPGDVVAALQLKPQWMKDRLPDPATFLDVGDLST